VPAAAVDGNVERVVTRLFAVGRELPAAIAAVREVWPPASDDASWVAGVQNGLVKDDLLRDAFGVRRLVCAVTIVGARRDDDGAVRCVDTVQCGGFGPLQYR